MSEKIQKLKKLWSRWNNTRSNAKEEYEKFMKKYPKDKISSMELDEYTNIDPGTNSYFTNFLERKTENCGKFRTASSYAYGIYKVNHNNIKDEAEKKLAQDKYKGHDRKNKKDSEAYLTKDDAQNYYETTIKPIVISLVKYKDIDEDKFKAVRPLEINYARKIAYMYNIDKLIPIYKKEVLESIAEFFGIKNDIDFSSYKATEIILSTIKDKFEIQDSIDIELSQKIGSFLWEKFGKSVSFDSKNIIYYGAPGTGKTYTVQNAVKQKVLQGDDDLEEVALFTQFHPSFGYEDFIEGLKPHIHNGATELKLTDGIFKEFCKKAMVNLRDHRKDSKNNNLKNYYFVVDEINRAELSTVFGELLLCLEESKRVDFNDKGELIDDSVMIRTQYSYLYTEDDRLLEGTNKFGVPVNLYFIGTMNDIDRSIDSFDLALRRRFIWKRMDCDYDVIVNSEKFKDIDNLEQYLEVCKNLNQYISKTLELGKSYEVGHAYFMDININQKRISKKGVQDLFDQRLSPLIQEYLRAEYSQLEIEKKLKEAFKIFSLNENNK